MPPQKEADGYKVCWMVQLKHMEGSTLMLFDFKGGPSLQFHRTKAADDDALSLINFLVGMKCPHPYDGVIPGRIA